ncbi:MAG: cupin domain-containing protein [Candidatus Bathyarchaeota archaeon]|nr:cupin domain-containing protein [Candidatus Bathyarchaeota archaeon]
MTSVDRVQGYDIDVEGACKARVKYLLHKGVGAKRLQLRLFTVDIGGYTPLEKHAHEHEVFMLRGRALLRGGEQEVELKPGYVIFIPPFEEHQFKNIGDEPVEFLCTKETT